MIELMNCFLKKLYRSHTKIKHWNNNDDGLQEIVLNDMKTTTTTTTNNNINKLNFVCFSFLFSFIILICSHLIDVM